MMKIILKNLYLLTINLIFYFTKENYRDENATAVAMVGARACSNYGRNMAKKIGERAVGKGRAGNKWNGKGS